MIYSEDLFLTLNNSFKGEVFLALDRFQTPQFFQLDLFNIYILNRIVFDCYVFFKKVPSEKFYILIDFFFDAINIKFLNLNSFKSNSILIKNISNMLRNY